MNDDELRHAFLRIAQRASVSPRPADARQRGAALAYAGNDGRRRLPRRWLSTLVGAVAIVAVAVPVGIVLWPDEQKAHLVTNNPSTTALVQPSTTRVAATTSSSTSTSTSTTTTTTNPLPPPTTTAAIAAGPAPVGTAATTTCTKGHVSYACPVRMTTRAARWGLTGLRPNTLYAVAQCLTTTSPTASDCAPSEQGQVTMTDATGAVPQQSGPYLSLTRYLLVGRDVVDCVDVQCEIRLVVMDGNRVVETIGEPLVFADEPFPEVQAPNFGQLRDRVPVDITFPANVPAEAKPYTNVQVCFRRSVSGPFPTSGCVLAESTLVEATATSVQLRFWPSRWAFGSGGIDCSVAGTCWVTMFATGDASYPYDRPIVVRGDTPAPSITGSPVGGWVDGQRITVSTNDLGPRRIGMIALCLDAKRALEVQDRGSGDGLSPSCTNLGSLTPTEVGTWPPSTETFVFRLSRTLVDSNGDKHDCGLAAGGCQIVALWGNDIYLTSGTSIPIWFAP